MRSLLITTHAELWELSKFFGYSPSLSGLDLPAQELEDAFQATGSWGELSIKLNPAVLFSGPHHVKVNCNESGQVIAQLTTSEPPLQVEMVLGTFRPEQQTACIISQNGKKVDPRKIVDPSLQRPLIALPILVREQSST